MWRSSDAQTWYMYGIAWSRLFHFASLLNPSSINREETSELRSAQPLQRVLLPLSENRRGGDLRSGWGVRFGKKRQTMLLCRAATTVRPYRNIVNRRGAVRGTLASGNWGLIYLLFAAKRGVYCRQLPQ